MKLRIPATLAVVVLSSACLPAQPTASQPFQRPGTSKQPVGNQAKPEAPNLRRLENGHYRVRRPWMVTLDGRTWTVQRGYTSNGITAPSSVKKSLGDGVEHPETWAAVFHDWLFTQPGISRGTADRLFLDLLLAYGVPKEKARLMHTTVSAYSLSKVLR
jgi:hypothetical protein